ncbi:MAG: hypothetical protein JST00_03740 [Deltaproteobacteria bacterium]|nr:hypothetical protein [Deltaproteobacteria bacterium]
MRLRRLLTVAASSSLLATSAARAEPPPSPTKAPRPSLDGAAFRAAPNLPPSAVSVVGRRVTVKGSFLEIDTTTASPSRIDLPIEHVDRGEHQFNLDLPGLVQGGFQCNARDLKIKVAFSGYARFTARVTKAGKTTELPGQENELLLKGFDTDHAGAKEMFTLRVVIGMVRPNVPTLVVEHEDQTILLTPEPAQPVAAPPALPKVFTLTTAGLPEFTLVEPAFPLAVAPPSAAAAVAAPAARNGAPAPQARNAAPVPQARNGVPAPAGRNAAPVPAGRNGAPVP